MTRSLAWMLHLANALAGGTGTVYAVLRYLVRPADAFAVVNHPWQPHALHLHVLLSPLLVLVIGHVLIAHAASHWRHGTIEGRRSGLAMSATVLPMIFSGYAIQASVSPGWRSCWITVHLVSSALWLTGFLVHWLIHRQRRSLSSGKTR